MKFELKWDEDGTPRAISSEPDGEIVARFFESDIQGGLHTANEIMEAVVAVEAGTSHGAAFQGNSLKAEIMPEGVCFENEDSPEDAPPQISLSEFKALLGMWIAMLAHPPQQQKIGAL